MTPISHQAFSFLFLLSFFTFAPPPPFFPPARRCSFSASFFFFSSFLHIYCLFFLSLLFSSLHTDAFVGFVVPFYGFICFCISGFCLGLCRGERERERERRRPDFCLWVVCLCGGWVFKGWDRWVWVAVVVGGGVALLACRAEQSRCSCYVHWWRVQPDATVSFWV